MTVKEIQRASGSVAIECGAIRISGASNGQALVHDGNEFVPTTIANSFSLSNTNAVALGSAAPGVANAAARSDHVHPTTGLALLSGATFSGGVVCNAGLTIGGTPAHLVTADSLSIDVSGSYLNVSLGGSDRARFNGNALLMGHTTSVGSSVAVVLANAGIFASLTAGGSPRSLLSLDANDKLFLGDELGNVQIACGNTAKLEVKSGGSVRFSVDNNGSVNVGTTSVSTLAGIILGNNKPLYGELSGGGVFRNLARINGSNVIELGDGNNTTQIAFSGGGSLKLLSNTTEVVRVHNDGGVVVGSAVVGTALGSVGIGLANNTALNFRDTGNTAWVAAIKLDSTDIMKIGTTAVSQVDFTCGTLGGGLQNFNFIRGSTTELTIDDGGVTSGQTSLWLLSHNGTSSAIRRVKVATSGTVPGGGFPLYV